MWQIPRYRLVPYLYSEYMVTALNDDMYFKPLGFVYPDDKMAIRGGRPIDPWK